MHGGGHMPIFRPALMNGHCMFTLVDLFIISMEM